MTAAPDFITHDVPGYQLLDSGDGRKLEDIAGHRRMQRPDHRLDVGDLVVGRDADDDRCR